MVPFLTDIDGVRANLFSINPQQKMTPTMVNQQLFLFCFVFVLGCFCVCVGGGGGCLFLFLFCFWFFAVKLDETNSIPSNTAEVRPICRKMGHMMRQPVFVICEQQRLRSACASTQSVQRLCCSLPG